MPHDNQSKRTVDDDAVENAVAVLRQSGGSYVIQPDTRPCDGCDGTTSEVYQRFCDACRERGTDRKVSAAISKGEQHAQSRWAEVADAVVKVAQMEGDERTARLIAGMRREAWL